MTVRIYNTPNLDEVAWQSKLLSNLVLSQRKDKYRWCSVILHPSIPSNHSVKEGSQHYTNFESHVMSSYKHFLTQIRYAVHKGQSKKFVSESTSHKAQSSCQTPRHCRRSILRLLLVKMCFHICFRTSCLCCLHL